MRWHARNRTCTQQQRDLHVCRRASAQMRGQRQKERERVCVREREKERTRERERGGKRPREKERERKRERLRGEHTMSFASFLSGHNCTSTPSTAWSMSPSKMPPLSAAAPPAKSLLTCTYVVFMCVRTFSATCVCVCAHTCVCVCAHTLPSR